MSLSTGAHADAMHPGTRILLRACVIANICSAATAHTVVSNTSANIHVPRGTAVERLSQALQHCIAHTRCRSPAHMQCREDARCVYLNTVRGPGDQQRGFLHKSGNTITAELADEQVTFCCSIVVFNQRGYS